MACSVVCISRAMGAGGEDVGRLVAERLGFEYADDEVVARAAAKAGLDAGVVADEEERKGLASRVLQALARSGGAEGLAVGGMPIHTTDEPAPEDIRVLIRETIEHTAAAGKVVIVAHAASYALGEKPDVLRVLVTASPATRAKRLGESESLDESASAKAVKDSDAARRDYLKRFYGVGDESPTHYDLVLNTDKLAVDQAAELISVAAG
ncbi:MAG TPA: cytidylate kinase-like family protein [Gaiellaceae bacterium]|nr:cytidylate kinase-like family protein [Gaiellaceae bacterium]